MLTVVNLPSSQRETEKVMDVKFNLQSPVTLKDLYYKLLGNNKNNVNIKCGTSQKQKDRQEKDDTNLIERFF